MTHFDKALASRDGFAAQLDALKATAPEIPWYPYGSINNIQHLAPLITPELDALFAPGRRFADIGAADGDLSFYMERLGSSSDVIDFGPTNYNTLRGVRALKDALSSSVNIIEANLDAQFDIDRTYDFVFFLGILYHLKNPFYALEKLATLTRYAFISTRIAAHFTAGGPDVSGQSAAYLLGPDESNGDATNYWIFTEAGLKRILDRTGWEIISYYNSGSDASNPQDNNRDQRAFCAVRSRVFR